MLGLLDISVKVRPQKLCRIGSRRVETCSIDSNGSNVWLRTSQLLKHVSIS